MFTEHFTIYHSHCDRNGYLKTDLFQEMILNTACSAAEAGGFGIPTLNRLGLTWVMARFQMHVNQHPRIGDKLKIETWIEQNRMGFSIRNFRVSADSCLLSVDSCPDELKTENCELKTVIAEARSAWAVIDVKSRESVNFNELQHIPVPEGNPVDLPTMPRPDRKAATISTEHTVRFTDLDQNGHCNSSRYLGIMLDAYGSIDGLLPRDLLVSYSHETFFGETLKVSRTQTEDPFFAIHNPQGELCVSAHFVL